MISRFDFFKDQISSDNPTYDLTHYYNEISVLYGLIGGRSDVDIFTSNEKGKFGFSVLAETDELASSLRDRYNHSHFTVYGETYEISTKMRKSDTVFITMIKKEA